MTKLAVEGEGVRVQFGKPISYIHRLASEEKIEQSQVSNDLAGGRVVRSIFIPSRTTIAAGEDANGACFLTATRRDGVLGILYVGFGPTPIVSMPTSRAAFTGFASVSR